MIGHVSIGSSFYHCISYCLEDKKELSEQQKQELSVQDHLQHRERAEVLEYNKCFGDKHELTQQFKDVQKLNNRVEKPVLHLSLRLAPGETLSLLKWAELAPQHLAWQRISISACYIRIPKSSIFISQLTV
ncbi:hypothetical protein MB380_17015 [Emticicia sp. 21SJ11W-3]|nr:hypothetical protein [Emticicia sp. 21SJ11W-3]UTA70414.1 hypothetical protein MB380_17015 [Emticicia sp. 21SJ11W-3]